MADILLLKSDNVEMNQYALNYLVKIFYGFNLMRLCTWNTILILAIVSLKRWISTSHGGILCCNRCIPSLVWNLEIHLYPEDGGKWFLRNVFIYLMLLQDGTSRPSTWRRFSLKPSLQGRETDADGCLNKLIDVAVIVKWTKFILIYNLCLGHIPIIWVL